MIFHAWAERVNVDVIIYADDSTLVCATPTLVSGREKVQVELNAVTKWVRIDKVMQNYLC